MSAASRFYRKCFYNDSFKVHKAVGGDSILDRILHLRYKKLGAFFKIFNRTPELRASYPFLCRTLKMCTTPSYLSKKPASKARPKAKRCSKMRYCPFCWNRIACRSYLRMTKRKDKLEGYVYAYSERVVLLPMNTPYPDICATGLKMFTPVWKYRSLNSKQISGIAEHLVVHSAVSEDGLRSFKLTLRRIAYCHQDSDFAKTSVCSSTRLGSAAVSFCSFPLSIMYDGPLRTIKMDEAFRRRRLVRQYGSFYSPG